MLYFTALKNINVFMSQVDEMRFYFSEHFKCLKSPTVKAFYGDSLSR